jgi:hypothetical protein
MHHNILTVRFPNIQTKGNVPLLDGLVNAVAIIRSSEDERGTYRSQKQSRASAIALGIENQHNTRGDREVVANFVLVKTF